MYGKATETAIAAMSRLAEVWDEGKTRLSADEIARDRKLQRPFVAKVLTTLSQARLVVGSRGPGGGFALARAPKRIKLIDVFRLFERDDDSINCPFGGGTCGVGEPCPLHHKLVGVQEAVANVLHHTTFDVFEKAAREREASGASPRAATRKKRETFRAPLGR
ncbi:MAG: Rrf2 family transcriptional regulator [Planctomycetes bacterium]|nr:Rrf2 family transcriptional regulator [Planctomycetota bacterium]MCC7172401.1 Rrf2 family transcriptional regulator [Planctomycetota bacterium]